MYLQVTRCGRQKLLQINPKYNMMEKENLKRISAIRKSINNELFSKALGTLQLYYSTSAI
jgi:hypothetical protein